MKNWVVFASRRGKIIIPFGILLVLCVYWSVMSFIEGNYEERLQTIVIEDSEDKLNTLVPSPLISKQHRKEDDNANRMYNLLREADKKEANNLRECSLKYINANKLEQDHPCVIDIIRRRFLEAPSPPDAPYILNNKATAEADHSQAGQVTTILNYLNNKTKGFFIECGANDGEFASNTLYMENALKWEGVLIEANKDVYKTLLSRNRKAWKSPACLSTEPYPMATEFQNMTGKSDVPFLNVADDAWVESKEKFLGTPVGGKVTVQCFPLYSILLALNRTTVDFFSLDIDGFELKTLKTIPWHKVDIKTITAEISLITDHIEMAEFVHYMESIAGYTKLSIAYIDKLPLDIIFVKRNTF